MRSKNILAGIEKTAINDEFANEIRDKSITLIVAIATISDMSIRSRVKGEFIDWMLNAIIAATGGRILPPAIKPQIEAIIAEAIDSIDDIRTIVIDDTDRIHILINRIINTIIIKIEAIIEAGAIIPHNASGKIIDRGIADDIGREELIGADHDINKTSA